MVRVGDEFLRARGLPLLDGKERMITNETFVMSGGVNFPITAIIKCLHHSIGPLISYIRAFIISNAARKNVPDQWFYVPHGWTREQE